MIRDIRPPRRHAGQRGQALVEFAVAIPIFLVLCMGIFDFGRGVFMYNGVAQAAREIARATSTDLGTVLGEGSDAKASVTVQRALLPNMGTPTFTCVDQTGAANGHSPCRSGDYVRVTVTASYTPVTLLGLSGPFVMSSTSSALVP